MKIRRKMRRERLGNGERRRKETEEERRQTRARKKKKEPKKKRERKKAGQKEKWAGKQGKKRRKKIKMRKVDWAIDPLTYCPRPNPALSVHLVQLIWTPTSQAQSILGPRRIQSPF